MAAQPQQNKPQEVIINLKAEVQKLKEMRDAIELMKHEGKLANVNENTYRALFNQIEQTIKRMNEGIRDGAIGASGLKSIQRGFESITSSIGKMVSQEKSTGMGLTEYNKKHRSRRGERCFFRYRMVTPSSSSFSNSTR